MVDQKYSAKDFGAIDDIPPSGTYVRVRDDTMTADQQIRAKALECAARLMEKGMASDMLLKLAEQFERYIREGK